MRRACLETLAKSIYVPRLLLRFTRVSFPCPLLVRTVGAILLFLLISPTSAARLFAADLHLVQRFGERTQQAPNCVEVVTNGSFEQTATGWQSIAGASLFTYATDQFISGQHSLLLGFTVPLNIPVTFGVEQPIALPAESSSIEFAFHYAIEIEGDAGPGDQAYLTFTDIATNQVLALLVLSPTNGAWSLGLYDLTPLAGQNMRMAFAVQDDGEPGRVSMRVDDVSVLACLPAESLALQPLPTPTPTPLPPQPLLLLPEPVPTEAPTEVPTEMPTAAPGVPPAATPAGEAASPQAGTIETLSECSCNSGLYACSDFSSWALAQACYTQCQVSAGYDIHNLDTDRNGVACELELQDVAPLDATPSPQPTPSAIPQTNSTDPNAPPAVAGAVTESLPSAAAEVAVAPAPLTTPVAASDGTTITPTSATTSTVATTAAVAMAESSTTVTTTVPATVAVASAPRVEADASTTPGDEEPASSLSPLEMLALLLVSPLGLLLFGALVVFGALGLWIAYLLGQRSSLQRETVAGQTIPEEFALQPSNEAPAPKA
jgi:hypothetical protein